ncbi:MAG TPA: methylated-DNA--[protein]-cysteine S-methyltransferase, partial [Chitinophagaceae bacterium]|nr:methylated-DNA--[protein]-cysteine S-methyltransferase [Chitinophagaceae bacterium]
QLDYERIAEAIRFLAAEFRNQPKLEEVAARVHLSPFHFQRKFTDWAGISPKKFLQFATVQYSKTLLHTGASTLFDAAFEAGLSGTGRLHDLFIRIESMTPGEYRNGGASLRLAYSFGHTPFGAVIVASTDKGICHLSFCPDEPSGVAELRRCFPQATIVREEEHPLHAQALDVFRFQAPAAGPLRLHLKGSPFQVKVWETLLKIPGGQVASYGQVARHLQLPQAGRAVGSAIGANPVAYLIPCHRVIRSTGILGQYHWGTERKAALLAWEAEKMENR